jgi:hypothetical protein
MFIAILEQLRYLSFLSRQCEFFVATRELYCDSKEQICPYLIKIMSSGEGETRPEYLEYEGVFSNVFSSRAVSQIVDFFLDHKEFDYSPGEIARKTGLSFRTVFRELPHLEKNQLIYISRKIGKTNMYRLNIDLQAVTFLENFAFEMSQLHISEPELSLNREGIAKKSA